MKVKFKIEESRRVESYTPRGIGIEKFQKIDY